MISNLFKKKLIIIICILIQINISESKDSFSIAQNLLNLIKCTPFAYGDFNADKLIDIFCVTDLGDKILD